MFRLLSFVSCSLTLGASTVYMDYASWLAAVQALPNTSVVTENFNNNQINTPGLTLVDTANPPRPFADPGGSITNDEFVATPYKYSVGATWSFNQAMNGFGADFSMYVVSGLMFILDDDGTNYQTVSLGPPLLSDFTGFFGFVSQQPFDRVQVVWGAATLPYTQFGQSYAMDNLSIAYDPPASAPEPATSALFLLAGLITAGLFGRSRVLKFCRVIRLRTH